MNKARNAIRDRAGTPGCVALGKSVYLSGLKVFISKIQEVGETWTLTPLGPSSSDRWEVTDLSARPPTPQPVF